MKKISFFILFLSCSILYAQEKLITYNGSGNYIYIERTDLRRYDNGKYIGLVNKEVRSFVTTSDYNNGYVYDGNFFVHQETHTNSVNMYNGIHDSIPSTFKINEEGVLTMIEDHGYPSFRSFPSYSARKIKIGDSWQAKAERAVDPLNKGIVTKMPIYVQYTYLKDDYFHDEPVFLLSAQWATRYGMGSGTSYIDWGGDKELSKATGSHKATIIVSKSTGNALVVRDTVDETFVYTDGNSIAFKGTISMFTEYPPSINRDKLLPALKRLAKLSDSDVEDLKQPAKLEEPGEKDGFLSDFSEKIAKNDVNSDNFSEKTSSVTDRMSNNTKYNDKDSSDTETQENTTEYDDHESDQILNKNKSEAIAKVDKSNELRNKIRNNLNSGNSIESKTNSVIDGDSTIASKSISSENNKSDEKITVSNTPAGIRLTMQNLQFKADSAELLPNEKANLDKIAEVLKLVPECQFLIEGHTASTGRTAGEMQLSLERAHSIAKELAKRGINENNFICKGSGGTKPVADNTTSEGRARNRRVEITILE